FYFCSQLRRIRVFRATGALVTVFDPCSRILFVLFSPAKQFVAKTYKSGTRRLMRTFLTLTPLSSLTFFLRQPQSKPVCPFCITRRSRLHREGANSTMFKQ